MITKLTKIKTIIMAVLATFIGYIFILNWLPKFIAFVSSSFGKTLDSSDLLTKYCVGISVRLIGVLICIYFMKKANIIQRFKWNIDSRYIGLSLMLVIYIGANFEYVKITNDNIGLALIMVINSLFIGLYEEVLFRGVILSLLLKQWGQSRKQVYFSVIIGSTIFGLFHLNNLFSGAPLVAVIGQVIYAIILGIAFSALLLRTKNNLIWCVLMHGLYDMASGFGDLVQKGTVSTNAAVNILPYLINVLMFIPILIFALFILRKVKNLNTDGDVLFKGEKNENSNM